MCVGLLFWVPAWQPARSWTSHEQLCASPQENAIHNGLIPLESQELRAGLDVPAARARGRRAGSLKPAADRSTKAWGRFAKRGQRSARVGLRDTRAPEVSHRGEQMPSIKPSPPCNAGKRPHVFWVMVPHVTDQGERLAIVASAAARDRRITHDAFCLQTFGGEPQPDHGNDQHRVIRPVSAARYVTAFGSSGEHVRMAVRCARSSLA